MRQESKGKCQRDYFPIIMNVKRNFTLEAVIAFRNKLVFSSYNQEYFLLRKMPLFLLLYLRGVLNLSVS